MKNRLEYLEKLRQYSHDAYLRNALDCMVLNMDKDAEKEALKRFKNLERIMNTAQKEIWDIMKSKGVME